MNKKRSGEGQDLLVVNISLRKFNSGLRCDVIYHDIVFQIPKSSKVRKIMGYWVTDDMVLVLTLKHTHHRRSVNVFNIIAFLSIGIQKWIQPVVTDDMFRQNYSTVYHKTFDVFFFVFNKETYFVARTKTSLSWHVFVTLLWTQTLQVFMSIRTVSKSNPS